jgi:hypothetical protein
VRCADGQILKLVRAASVQQAKLVERISRRLDAAVFSPVLERAGAVLLTPWIAGDPLDLAGWQAADVHAAAAILAALHRTPAQAIDAPQDVRVAAYAARLDAQLIELVDGGLISAAERHAWYAAAETHAPARAPTGIIHRDLCAENLVRRACGALCVVDIETLTLGCYDYDLARTWYRWPLPAEQRVGFFETYAAAHAPARDALRHFPFWAICSMAMSATLRRRRDPAGAAAPLQRLRALVGALQDGAAGAELALQP